MSSRYMLRCRGIGLVSSKVTAVAFTAQTDKNMKHEKTSKKQNE